MQNGVRQSPVTATVCPHHDDVSHDGSFTRGFGTGRPGDVPGLVIVEISRLHTVILEGGSAAPLVPYGRRRSCGGGSWAVRLVGEALSKARGSSNVSLRRLLLRV